MGFANGQQWKVPHSGHMDLSDGRIGDVSVTVNYNLPPGWVYDAFHAQLGYVLLLPINDLLQGFKSTITTPCDEVIPVEIPQGLLLSQILFEPITIRANGYGGFIMYDHASETVIRGDAVIAIKADVKSMPSDTLLQYLVEAGLDKNDPLFKRFLALISKRKGGKENTQERIDDQNKDEL